MNIPTERMVEISGWTDGLREMFATKEREYRRARIAVGDKQRAEWVVAFLLEKERAATPPVDVDRP